MTEDEKLTYLNKELNADYANLNQVPWWYISKYQHLSEEFIREFKDNVDWRWGVSLYQHLSDGFIREFKDNVGWSLISEYQHLSEDFIREFQDKVYWFWISKYQHLSEDFIREFSDRVDWDCISIYQKLSEDFIREFKDNVDWRYISKHQHLSKDFIREFKEKVDLELMADNWCYKDKEFLKEQVVNTGLYECYEDYFIAYKGIRSDRYSNFNFHYQYLQNGVYESHCDCSFNEDSFGLSAWTKEKAAEYCDELVVKVRINYEDVGRVVHDSGKIRCRKLMVLE